MEATKTNALPPLPEMATSESYEIWRLDAFGKWHLSAARRSLQDSRGLASGFEYGSRIVRVTREIITEGSL